MYENFYGLRERPFELTSNPRFLLLTAKHREALSNLQYGLNSRRGLTVLIGDAGTGKTTLIRSAIESLEKQGAQLVYMNNPTLTQAEFYEFLADAFLLDATGGYSKPRLLAALENRLDERRASGRLTGFIIDEAQGLPDALLEEIRLLTNIETAEEKLLPLVLAGQTELAERLNNPSLRQLKQRVSLRCDLPPLNLHETAEYVAGRIRVAGGNTSVIFTRQAVEAIFDASGGIPRLISVICDNALISGFAAGCRPVTRRIVDEVLRDFDLPGRGTPVSGMDAIQLPVREAPEPPKAPDALELEPREPLKADSAAPPQDAARRGLFEQFSVRRPFSLFQRERSDVTN
jgi:general secretion pathway protein A